MRSLGNTPTICGALLILGCASGKTTAYVGPTGDTVLADIEVSRSVVPAHTIFMHNRSTVPIRIYALTVAPARLTLIVRE